MLEPWEKALLRRSLPLCPVPFHSFQRVPGYQHRVTDLRPVSSVSIFGFITFFFWWSVITYYPSHLAYLSRRFSYYVWGDESIDAGGVFREWLKDQLWRAWEGGKGLVGGGGTGSKVEL